MKKSIYLKSGFFLILYLSLSFSMKAQCDNSGIGTNTPASKLEVKGCTTTSAFSAFHATDSNGNSLFFVRNDGKVGVGLTNPEYPFHVFGTVANGPNGEVAKFQRGNYQTFFLSGAGASAYNPLTLANDNGLFWADGNVNSANGFVIAPWSNVAKGLRIAGSTGYVGIGTPAPASRLEVYENINLAAPVGSAQRISTFRWQMDNNKIMENLWLKRKNSTPGWNGGVIHDGISVDTSFSTPGTTTRTWWERDPNTATQSWGDQSTTFMMANTYKSGDNVAQPNLHVGEYSRKAVLGSAYGPNLGYGTAYLGFNASRRASDGTWAIISDDYNNGGSIIYGDIFGGIRFSTIPSTKNPNAIPPVLGNGNQAITDATIAANTRMYIDKNGNVGVGTQGPNSRFEVGGSFGLKINTTSVTTYDLADEVVLVANVTSATPIAVRLPTPAAAISGRTYTVKRVGTGAPATGAVNVSVIGGSSIDGVIATQALTGTQSFTFICNGNAWFIIN